MHTGNASAFYWFIGSGWPADIHPSALLQTWREHSAYHKQLAHVGEAVLARWRWSQLAAAFDGEAFYTSSTM